MSEYWNRRELYNLVWAEPMTKVAEKFGVSDVAIAKACRKLKVPVPGRGYWAKKANGHHVTQMAFREVKNVPHVAKPQAGRKKEAPAVDPRDQDQVDNMINCLPRGICLRAISIERCNSPLLSSPQKKRGEPKKIGVTYSVFR